MTECWAAARTLFEQGLSAGQQNLFHKAGDLFARARQECPGAPFGLHGKLFVADARGKRDEARRIARQEIPLIETLLVEHPELADGYVRFLYGVALEQGRDDREAARAQYELSCAAGEPRGCNNLGKYMEDIAGDPARALELYRQACVAGYGRGCLNQGVVLEKRDPAAVEPDALYRRSCDLRHPSGCFHAGRLAMNRGERETAMEFFARACTLGHQLSCQLKDHPERVEKTVSQAEKP